MLNFQEFLLGSAFFQDKRNFQTCQAILLPFEFLRIQEILGSNQRYHWW